MMRFFTDVTLRASSYSHPIAGTLQNDILPETAKLQPSSLDEGSVDQILRFNINLEYLTHNEFASVILLFSRLYYICIYFETISTKYRSSE